MPWFSHPDLIYHAMLGALFTHELDAVQRHEWRVLPLTSFLPDRLGMHVFIWLHLPLFTLILRAEDAPWADGFRLGVAVFAIVHVGLHVLYRRHPAYEFNNPGSWALILLGGLLGAGYLLGVSVLA